jgi:hypothetical protein
MKITHSIIWRKGKEPELIVHPPDYDDDNSTDKGKVYNDNLSWINELLDVSIADCIGCGYCCAKAPCSIATSLDCWSPETGCEALIWNGSRHLCHLVVEDPDVFGKLLAIGAGCSSSLFNSYRENVKSLVGTHLK